MGILLEDPLAKLERQVILEPLDQLFALLQHLGQLRGKGLALLQGGCLFNGHLCIVLPRSLPLSIQS